MSSPSRPLFTRNQRQVLALMIRGKRAHEIAEALQITCNSVDTCCMRMRQRVAARTNAELIAQAIVRGGIDVRQLTREHVHPPG